MQEASSSFKDSNGSFSDSDREEILFMEMEIKDDALEYKDKQKEEELEGEKDVIVDLEEELICALDKIKKLKKNSGKTTNSRGH